MSTRIPEHDRLPISERRDLAADQVMRSELRMRTTAAAIDDFTQKLQMLDTSLAQKGVAQEIESGTGTVVVRGNGDLATVRLDSNAIRNSDMTKLGARIIDAITAAEEKARTVRQRHLQGIQESLHRE